MGATPGWPCSRHTLATPDGVDQIQRDKLFLQQGKLSREECAP
jgi:hypothetical protein